MIAILSGHFASYGNLNRKRLYFFCPCASKDLSPVHFWNVAVWLWNCPVLFPQCKSWMCGWKRWTCMDITSPPSDNIPSTQSLIPSTSPVITECQILTTWAQLLILLATYFFSSPTDSLLAVILWWLCLFPLWPPPTLQNPRIQNDSFWATHRSSKLQGSNANLTVPTPPSPFQGWLQWRLNWASSHWPLPHLQWKLAATRSIGAKMYNTWSVSL